MYRPTIGLEVHAELKTLTKLFCNSKNDPDEIRPNVNICPVCMGYPGTLPVLNHEAVRHVLRVGLALGGNLADYTEFDRKNYFYPDIPKGYQISQYKFPLVSGGMLNDIEIERVHLEEDTGKLQHTTLDGKRVTLVDFNRSGVPLVEIVTEPDIRSPEQAKEFLKKLYQIIRYLDISDADMEKGSMRLEPNISVRPTGTKALPNYKVEVKNINSFNFVKKAIEFEVDRHIKLLESGETPVQETRGWNEGKGVTVSQRRKEEADDYRYFPEPDIPPARWDSSQIIGIKLQIPELPDQKAARFKKEYQLNDYDTALLTDTKQLADYFEECVKINKIPAKKLVNWIINKKVDIDDVLPATLVKSIIAATAVVAIPDEDLEKTVQTVIAENPKAVEDYKKGKQQAMMFLFGAVLKQLKGAGDKNLIRELLEVKIKS